MTDRDARVVATIRVPALMRAHTQGRPEIRAEGHTVHALLLDAVRQHAGLRAQLFDDNAELRRFVRLFLNSEDIQSQRGLDSVVHDGDVLEMLPAIAGGIDDALVHHEPYAR